MLHDLKHAARQLARQPGFTLTAVLTLAIGLGVNAVAFSVVNGLVFKGTLGAPSRGVPGAPAATLVRPVQEAARAVDPDVAMTAVKTMTERAAVQLWPFRPVSKMFSICGALALILATVGLAGVVSHAAVSRRTREFGVRMSIGATAWDLTADVPRGSARLLAPGLVVGLIVAAILARLARVALIGVNVLNPATYLIVALLQSAIVVLACVRPALRASRVDPLIALRAE